MEWGCRKQKRPSSHIATSDIHRCLVANKPETAIDRLHTYCTKKIAHLLELRSIECGDDEPLHSRFGKYRKVLVAERSLSDFTDKAMKSAIGLLEELNDIRNNRSLPHDNTMLDPAEARYVFDTVSALLVLVRSVEAGRFEEMVAT